MNFCLTKKVMTFGGGGILEWAAIPFSRRSSQTQGSKPDLLHCRWILYHLSHQGSQRRLNQKSKTSQQTKAQD